MIAGVFGLQPGQVRVIAEHVGGGFGAKGTPRPNAVLAAMAARAVGRPVKCALSRQQHVRRGRAPGPVDPAGPARRRRRTAGSPRSCTTSSGRPRRSRSSPSRPRWQPRHMYAAPNRRTTHRMVRLDVPTPAWMRAPGECPGMFALESAMDELAVACGVDPVDLRIRNEPAVGPGDRHAVLLSRNLVACLREGAAWFGWAGRDPSPGIAAGRAVADRDRRGGLDLPGARAWRRRRWPASTPPAATWSRSPPWTSAPARAPRCSPSAADALGVPAGRRDAADRRQRAAPGHDRRRLDGQRVVELGRDRRLPRAARADPGPGRRDPGRAACPRSPPTGDAIDALPDHARYSFGAQFAEVRVDADTGEVRVPRLLGVFAGRAHRGARDGQVAVHRRHDHGAFHGPARREHDRPAVRRLPQP